mmetsp:Transcript_27295/g.32279  ORF Transcript_27295/g.32279 Transcript_27295/m.32279 type:complete len:318 (+) Transcript_27295:61-1014(+)
MSFSHINPKTTISTITSIPSLKSMAHRRSDRIAEAILKSMLPRRSDRIAAAARAVATAAKKKPASMKKRSKKNPPKPSYKRIKKNHKSTTHPSAVIIHPSAALGVIDHEANIRGTIVRLDNEPSDAMLVLIDPAKNMDKFFILQLIDRAEGSYVVYTRWGQTGTSGQALEEDFDELSKAVECFKGKFKEETGLVWEKRTDPTIGSKYRFIQQNFDEKRGGFLGAKWQYWVDDGVDGKMTNWYDYSATGSVQAERLYQEHLSNARLTNRLVESGWFTYDVNMVQMTQTNVKHQNKTARRIRRCPNPGPDRRVTDEIRR